MSDLKQAARDNVAYNYELHALHSLMPDYGYAGHVTQDEKIIYSNDMIIFADEVRQGEHDNNFTIAQKMHYFLTGECIALLGKWGTKSHG